MQRFSRASFFLTTLLVTSILPLTQTASAGGGLCCPQDLTADGVVDAADLSILLGAWGPVKGGSSADLDGSQFVDAADLALLLGAWGACPSSCLTTLVVGSVAYADGSPVSDAVIITQFGGEGVSDELGAFSFEVDVEKGARSLQVTAVATVNGVNFAGSTAISPIELGGVTDAGVITITEGAACDPSWLPTFGTASGVSNTVRAIAVFDDGGGPEIYAGGDFTIAGGVSVNRIARWDGAAWSPLTAGASVGVNNRVRALKVFDDGGGPALIVGGDFTLAGTLPVNRIAKWDGQGWSSLGTGFNNDVNALEVFDDGSGNGPSLIAAGPFTQSGATGVSRIARWNGTSWSPLGSGVNAEVHALATFDDGIVGPALYAGGFFNIAGGTVASRIARWNGSSWSPVGSGIGGVISEVYALTTFDDQSGNGPSLIAGGDFTAAGGVAANRVASWNGTSWSALGSGVNDTVFALAAMSDPTSGASRLVATGDFTTAGGVAAQRIAQWENGAWSPLGAGMNDTGFALAEADLGDGQGPVLFAGGDFWAGSGALGRLAKWNGNSWSTLGSGVTGTVLALAAFDADGDGPELYAGGTFSVAGGVQVNHIAKWDGAAWSGLGSGPFVGVNNSVWALTVFDDGQGSGPALYAGGAFGLAGGVNASCIAKWDGSSWSAVGLGMSVAQFLLVQSLFVFDADGAGSGEDPKLIAGGSFTAAGGVPASNIAQWDGISWSPLGSGTNGSVRAMAAFDQGSGGGTELVVAGSFLVAGGQTVNRIARWNGTTWSPFVHAGTIGVNDIVEALATFDDGTGEALYVGGFFTSAGGVPASRIAKWDGQTWSTLGVGPSAGVSGGAVFSLSAFNDGTGPALFAGGSFTSAGGIPVDYLAKWTGSSWSPVGSGSGMDSFVQDIASVTLGTSSSLIVGGSFGTSASGDSHVAQWGCTGEDE